MARLLHDLCKLVQPVESVSLCDGNEDTSLLHSNASKASKRKGRKEIEIATHLKYTSE